MNNAEICVALNSVDAIGFLVCMQCAAMNNNLTTHHLQRIDINGRQGDSCHMGQIMLAERSNN